MCAVAGQILRYMNWTKKNIADGKEVKGIIIEGDIDDKLKWISLTSNGYINRDFIPLLCQIMNYSRKHLVSRNHGM